VSTVQGEGRRFEGSAEAHEGRFRRLISNDKGRIERGKTPKAHPETDEGHGGSGEGHRATTAFDRARTETLGSRYRPAP